MDRKAIPPIRQGFYQMDGRNANLESEVLIGVERLGNRLPAKARPYSRSPGKKKNSLLLRCSSLPEKAEIHYFGHNFVTVQ